MLVYRRTSWRRSRCSAKPTGKSNTKRDRRQSPAPQRCAKWIEQSIFLFWGSRKSSINEPIGALVHLQLGRAYVLAGDTAKAKTAYQDFFAPWKDADSDIPVLKEAKAEYAKLK